ncbi:hypothetical protein PoB_004801400 [Plakobranchus ocellatus]|uniref:Galectin n=1 Tax=Plakobranchus ocellatus TaxID=259542 RepID=A0AAV4BT09_9GAST|nr:hypothetical protein PoB_004801400 [Plakobranchus ocellatus]
MLIFPTVKGNPRSLTPVSADSGQQHCTGGRPHEGRGSSSRTQITFHRSGYRASHNGAFVKPNVPCHALLCTIADRVAHRQLVRLVRVYPQLFLGVFMAARRAVCSLLRSWDFCPGLESWTGVNGGIKFPRMGTIILHRCGSTERYSLQVRSGKTLSPGVNFDVIVYHIRLFIQRDTTSGQGLEPSVSNCREI